MTRYIVEYRPRANQRAERTVEAESPHAAVREAAETAPEGYYVAAVEWGYDEGLELLAWCADCGEPLLEGDDVVSTAADVDLCWACASAVAAEVES